MLCTITASALSYASPYKGAGRGGYIYTTSSARQHTISTGLAQAPVASMASTSGSYASRGIAYASTSAASVPSVQGIRTSASNVSGGITSGDTYSQIGTSGRRRGPELPPGACSHCDWYYDEETGTWRCHYCDCEPEDGECDHNCVPVGDGWEVWLFIAALAGAYALYKVRAGKKSNGDVRDAYDMRMRMTAI